MAGHVIRPLAGVLKPRGILWHEAIEELVQITPRGGGRVFHDHEAATGVADKNGKEAFRDAAPGENLLDGVRDFHCAFAAGLESKSFVLDGVRIHPAKSGARRNPGKMKLILPMPDAPPVCAGGASGWRLPFMRETFPNPESRGCSG